MKIVSVFKDYTINFLNSTDEIQKLQEMDNAYFVIDDKVYDLYKNMFSHIMPERMLLVNAIETNKNIDTVLMICEKMTQLDSKRNTILVSIGGGIIQDITGFVANILYRGIKWIYIPTTLLAMCDSCIGGKSSLNFKHFKNILGSFYPPDNIMIYLDFLKTLSLSDYYSGLGEVVKFNIIAGKTGIDKIEAKLEALLIRDNSELSEFVLKSLQFKKNYIEEDEFDKGKRIFLNFAHTFGHAFESTSSYQIPHGTAVVLGMIIANAISLQRNLLDEKLTNRIEKICKKILNIKIQEEWFEINAVINAIKKDKKQTNSSIRAILLNNDFSLGIYNDISILEIIKAIDHLMDILNVPGAVDSIKNIIPPFNL